MEKVHLAAVQMISGSDVSQNIQTMTRLVQDTAKKGAKIVLLPEFWAFMGAKDVDKLAIAETYQNGVLQTVMSHLAKECQVYLVGGTIPLVSPNPKKVYNSMLTFDPQGQCVGRYDKIHLFSYKGAGESFSEADTILAGGSISKLILPFINIAQAICYDLRFPELFRMQQNFDLILLPAAFTYTTGKAHWLTLLTARAIESQSYLLASNQGGVHENGRRTFGHSVLISPWGEILDALEEGEGIVQGMLDFGYLNSIRRHLPALENQVFKI
ncbi:carbon-nitrogen hydrolase family protein [Neisseria sp. Ec49-e6-T10]|uniref:carbon-nitrogen hydrolase family protein n=1 Tax=Neisseria sp. Ec49-e6-T10 TaxID=3140744 RepID=UPI003EB69758